MTYWKITTEADCEGRTTTTIGYFKGNKEQVATYLVDNNIEPYYKFNFKEVRCPLVDLTTTTPLVSVELDSIGRATIHTSEETHKNKVKLTALGKLTKEEKEVLGL